MKPRSASCPHTKRATHNRESFVTLVILRTLREAMHTRRLTGILQIVIVSLSLTPNVVGGPHGFRGFYYRSRMYLQPEPDVSEIFASSRFTASIRNRQLR